MSFSLNNHARGYSLTSNEVLTSVFLPPLSASTYAARHGECALKSEGKTAWGHRTVQILEYIPLVGILVGMIERISMLVYQYFFQDEAKSVTTVPSKISDEDITKFLMTPEEAKKAAEKMIPPPFEFSLYESPLGESSIFITCASKAEMKMIYEKWFHSPIFQFSQPFFLTKGYYPEDESATQMILGPLENSDSKDEAIQKIQQWLVQLGTGVQKESKDHKELRDTSSKELKAERAAVQQLPSPPFAFSILPQERGVQISCVTNDEIKIIYEKWFNSNLMGLYAPEYGRGYPQEKQSNRMYLVLRNELEERDMKVQLLKEWLKELGTGVEK